MIGGEDDVVARLDPIFESIAPGGEPPRRDVARMAHRGDICTVDPTARAISSRWSTTASRVRHDAAIAEGLSIIKHANVGLLRAKRTPRLLPSRTPSTTPTRSTSPTSRGLAPRSVVSSWLVDLTAAGARALAELSGSASRCRTRAKGAGREGPPSTSPYRHR